MSPTLLHSNRLYEKYSYAVYMYILLFTVYVKNSAPLDAPCYAKFLPVACCYDIIFENYYKGLVPAPKIANYK